MSDEGDARVALTRATYERIAEPFAARTRDRSAMRSRLDGFAARLRPGSLVYDLGCGPGFDAAELRARGLRVVGLDLSAAMLRTGEGPARGPRVQADLRRLPLRAASADGAWANASLLHVPRAESLAALREIARVLVPGGWLHVAVKEGASERLDVERYGPDAPRWFTDWRAEAFDAALGEAGFAIAAASTEVARDVWLVRLARRLPPMR